MNTRSKVIAVKCENYDYENVFQVFERLENLCVKNGIELPSSGNIILKPNMMSPDLPEKAVTTHPRIFEAVAKLLKKRGNIVFYGDSPGIGNIEKIDKISGIGDVASREKLERIDFEQEETLDFPDGIFCKKLILAKGLLKKGKIFNLPKLKTHGQMLYSGAIKNIFGCVPGVRKPEYHFKMLSEDNFAKLIVDVYRLVSPCFTVMDAVYAQEGNGPRNGVPRKLGVILAGTDALAIDAIAARIIGLKPENISILKYAQEFNAGNMKDIEVIGDEWQSFAVHDFKHIPSLQPVNGMPEPVVKFVKKYMVNKPVVDLSKCSGCKLCIEKCHAQPKAVYEKNGKVAFDYKKCIRCFCCQEVCPQGAIYVSENKLAKLLFNFYKMITE